MANKARKGSLLGVELSEEGRREVEIPRLFGEIAVAGADICTMKMEFMRLLYEHSFTEQRMNGFLKSWHGVFGDKTWPELP